MHFSEIFIRRPVLSTVLAAFILLLGFQGIFNLPVLTEPDRLIIKQQHVMIVCLRGIPFSTHQPSRRKQPHRHQREYQPLQVGDLRDQR